MHARLLRAFFFVQVKDNLVEAIRKDAFVSVECKLMRPEALCVGTQEEEEQEVCFLVLLLLLLPGLYSSRYVGRKNEVRPLVLLLDFLGAVRVGTQQQGGGGGREGKGASHRVFFASGGRVSKG